MILFLSIFSIILWLIPPKQTPSNSVSDIVQQRNDINNNRKITHIEEIEFIKSIKNNASLLNQITKETWYPLTIDINTIPDFNKNYLSKRTLFLKMGQEPNSSNEELYLDLISKDKFKNIKDYMVFYSKQLNQIYPNSKITVLADNKTYFLYKWETINDKKIGNQVEIGKVYLTDEGIFNIKYINKNNADKDIAIKKMIKFYQNT